MLYQIVVGPQIQDLKKLFDGYSKISKSTRSQWFLKIENLVAHATRAHAAIFDDLLELNS